MRIARATLIVLAVGTFVAFFVTQRLKGAPPVVRQVHATAAFSPVADGVRDEARISFALSEDGRVSVDVVDDEGEVVRELAIDQEAPAYEQLRFRWDGRDNDGKRAPDGTYRPQVVLEGQGRAVTLPAPIRLDTEPPRVVVTDVRPSGPKGPAVFPRAGRREVRAIFRGPARRRPEFLVYRTDDGPPRLVHRFPGRIGSHVGRWDGRIGGRRAPAGSYLISVRARDQAGNAGTAPPRLPPERDEVKGKPGLQIRYLAAVPPMVPVRAGEQASLRVDSGGRPYTWALTRAGRSRPVAEGQGEGVRLTLPVPAPAEPGPYLVELRAGDDVARVPLAVSAAPDSPPASVLVVLPAITWLGLDPVDDDGGGFPDTLESGDTVGTARPFTAPPSGWASEIVPLQRFLEREHLRYEVTTDLALARGVGPALDDHRGAFLMGSMRWVTPGLELALREFVERGGRITSTGVDALRRRVTLAGRKLRDPQPPAPEDALGASLGPLRREPVELLVFEDRIDLFRGTDGRFAGFDAFQETEAVQGDRLVAGAGPDASRPVIVGYRLGQGLVVRFGLPEWPRRLTARSQASTVTRRAWALLRR